MHATPSLWGAIIDVVAWLRSLGLGKYEAAFREGRCGNIALSGSKPTLRSRFNHIAMRRLRAQAPTQWR